MTELSQHAKSQLRLAKQGFEPQPGDRDRVRGALMTALALGAASATLSKVASGATVDTGLAGPAQIGGVASTGTQVTGGALLATQQGLLGKAILVAALAGGAAGTIGYQWGYTRGSQQATQPAAVQTRTTPMAATAPVTGPPVAAPPQTVVPPALPEQELEKGIPAVLVPLAAPVDPQPSGTHPDAEEVLQLERVQRALRDGYPALALAILSELDQKLPHGRLHEERSAARAVARCAMDGSAPAVLESFTKRYPGSMYWERVAAACATKSPVSATELRGTGQE